MGLRYTARAMTSALQIHDEGRAQAPIGVFDSGFGGLTVVRELRKVLPNESLIYLGDSARCPYGPRSLDEVAGFVRQIGSWLIDQGVKLIVIACNTATAAGLEIARKEFDVPVIGVVEPGARAAVATTENKRVGVIATKGTIDSGAYMRAIRDIDPSITVFATPTPRFVEIAEQGIQMAEGSYESFTAEMSEVYIRPAFQEITRDYLSPLKRCEIDTLVLGCTHYALLKTLIGSIIGNDVKLISSATEVSRDVMTMLQEQGLLAHATDEPNLRFCTTGDDVEGFTRFGSIVMKAPIENVEHVDLP